MRIHDSAVIDDPKEIDPEWLTDVLNAAGHPVRVRACRRESVGTGQMAHNERIFLEYDGDAGDAPATLVGKFPSPSEQSRAAGGAGAYLAEVRFYLDLAKDLKIRVPDCFYGALSEDGTRFTLLLEDMAPAVQGDQIAGASEAELVASVTELAGLHAPLWNSPRLAEVSWAPIKLNTDFAPIIEVAAKAFIERYDERLTPETKETLSGFAEGFARWVETEPEDRTLVHGDYRLDNQLYVTRGGETSVSTVDWQTISTGNGGRDLAYMLGNACESAQRRELESGLLVRYRESMLALGVALKEDAVYEAYRHGTFQGPYVTMLGSLAVGQTDRGDDMFMAMAERSCAQIRDLDALSLIR